MKGNNMAASAKPKTQPKALTTVMEDYLEAIFDLDKTKKVVRVRDIAGVLNVKMPTVTSMLKTLNERGLVNYEKYEYVELTREGAKVGREMHCRHEILFRFLTDILSVPPKTADDEACKMEHALGADTLNRLTSFMAFIQQCPRAGESWLYQFEKYQKQGKIPDNCTERAIDFAAELHKTSESKKKN
jgi:DtxR family Mn-dependent transcriptional regulator